MAHTHQAKRPYNGSQPSIASYFPAKTTSSSPTTRHERRSPSPALPQTVQANLLSVGMRVRKSVPEGYKTGTQYSGFGLFSTSTAPPSQPQPQPQRASPAPKKEAGGRPRARELTPFCGILKVGGLSMQQWGIYDSSGVGGGDSYDEEDDEEEEEDDDMPGLSSQGSTISASSVDSIRFGVPGAGNANKRRFFDDEDGGNTEQSIAWAGNAGLVGERVMAVPRRKRTGSLGLRRAVGQENGNGEVDFEDAEFLDYGLAVGGVEVEMGGV
ncbi:uncharacterized protein BP5553_06767 [Venustampulla echinocandica]|uniref:Uncharacterized protein n=1 Tax=Venustampulla echinocandica TaxID=2656787 RepID=A0A370TKW8_9HELO|nr:uncharacterized protein BP5553_06767 [Venustampulla echinocandica]RDL36155.1 hypothetical protein BP5553_06767 [Venustampulla echinocandica]